MSSINGDGKGNLLISYLFKSNKPIEQVREEMELKELIYSLLKVKGYKFIIADDSVINKELKNSVKDSVEINS